MGVGAGVLLVAVGAVLEFAVKVRHSHGFDVHTVGLILMVAGVAVVLLDLLLFMPRRRRTTVVTGGAPAQPAVVVDDRSDLV